MKNSLNCQFDVTKRWLHQNMCFYCSKPNKCSQTHYVLYRLANAFNLSALLDCPTGDGTLPFLYYCAQTFSAKSTLTGHKVQ